MAEATSQVPPGHSGRLKYADPRSLPSFPSSGLPADGAAAGAAASLGWNNQKTIEPWKPDDLSSASAAAVLAKDYKMAPSWEPQAQSDGHKAALLAVGSASSALKNHSPSPSNAHQGWGNSAATQAFHANRPASASNRDLSHGSSAATQAFNTNRSLSLRKANAPSPPSQGDRSLAAAKGAMSLTRQRAISSPDATTSESQLQSRAASSALNGATIAHRASMQPKPSIEDTGAVSVTTMTRNMFTANPPVKPEVDEQQNNERLHQSAVEMAKKMYSQQKKSEQARLAQGDEVAQADTASPYLNLQDAAYKQAQQRLAKLHDEHQKSRDFQEYYGNSQAPRRRFSVANKLRRRYSDDSLEDREQSEKIRQQMSMFSNKLSEVDQAKRKQDRDALLAAAQRNVKARLHGMDEKVYNETGKVNPSLLSDWEVKAQQAAQLRHETRTENKGMVNLGGGKFMDPDEVDAIAAKRLQPVLDDINEKAEAERARVAALKLEEEARKAELERQKARDREMKETQKQVREQGRQEEKARKLQEKDAKRSAKEEKRKSKHDSAKSGVSGSGDAEVEAEVTASDATRDETVSQPPTHETYTAPAVDTANTAEASTTDLDQAQLDDGPNSPTSKVKGWIKNRFSRRKSVVESNDEKGEKRRSFFRGGAALRNDQANASVSSLDNRASSMRDVAMAGRNTQHLPRTDSQGVSVDSSDSSEDEGPSRDRRSLSVMPPRPIEDPAPRSSVSPSRDSRFREEISR